MGDSYSSGEGNPPFDNGTALKRSTNTNKCHRSPDAWPRLRFRIDTPGTYMIMCSVPGHAEAGMHGRLIVTP